MTNRAAKEALFDEFAEIAKALSSGRRAEIIDVLSNGERSVESLAEQVQLSTANTSQHLQILKSAGLLASRRQGTFIYYRLACLDVALFWRSLQKIAQSSGGDVERLISEYVGEDDIQEVSRDELWEKIQRKDNLVVVDVRPVEEFDAGHIPGAISIPLGELEERMSELPKSRRIVVYCRGPVCAFAPEAARLLKSRGYKVKRLAEGAPDWGAAGLPLATAKSEP